MSALEITRDKKTDSPCDIFDLDGTLMDTAMGVGESVRKVLCEMGRPLPDDASLRAFIGPPIYESFQRLCNIIPPELNAATERFRSVYKDEFLLEASPIPGIFELLHGLRTMGFRLAVATNKRHDYTETLLEHFGFTPYFDVIQGSDFENKLKKPDIIALCMERMNAKAAATVMIGDSISDLNGAKSNGIVFFAVTYGFGFRSKEEALSLGASGVFDTAHELLRYFRKNSEGFESC